jgi:hypothetical protein
MVVVKRQSDPPFSEPEWQSEVLNTGRPRLLNCPWPDCNSGDLLVLVKNNHMACPDD